MYVYNFISITGILIRNGFWFNLETETWEAKRFPPLVTISEEPNALFSYQGRPTMFGSPICDGEGNCEYKEVLQYNEVSDTWDSLGSMVENRQLHYVIEVPNSFCDEFTSLEELVPESGSTFFEEIQEDEIETVAMIVGGFWDIDIGNGNQLQVIPEVELFGCPDSPDSSKILQDYPENVYLSGGRYFDDMDMVISCGGYSCQDLRCHLLNDCFQWTIENQWEPFTSNLNFDKWSHIMTEVVNLDGDGEMAPMVIGLNSVTEIWNANDNVWERYRDIPTSGLNWASMSCLFQEGDFIYHMRRDIERLDTTTWTLEVLGQVPEFLDQPGKCAYQEANGTPGNSRISCTVCTLLMYHMLCTCMSKLTLFF